MTDRQKTMLELPEGVVKTFETLDAPSRDTYAARLRNAGWTLQSIAHAAKLSRERVRQVVRDVEDTETVAHLPLPLPPTRPVKEPRVFVEPDPDTLARMLELQEDAKKVRSNSPEFRAEGEEYTRLLWKSHHEDGVTLYRMALRLGVSHGALRFRLARYGYKRPKTGTSKVYTPIKSENRVDSQDSTV